MGCQNHFSLMSLLTLDVSLHAHTHTHTHTYTHIHGTAIRFLEPSGLSFKASLVGQWAQTGGDREGEQGENEDKCSNSAETKKNRGDVLLPSSLTRAHLIKGKVWGAITGGEYTLISFLFLPRVGSESGRPSHVNKCVAGAASCQLTSPQRVETKNNKREALFQYRNKIHKNI